MFGPLLIINHRHDERRHDTVNIDYRPALRSVDTRTCCQVRRGVREVRSGGKGKEEKGEIIRRDAVFRFHRSNADKTPYLLGILRRGRTRDRYGNHYRIKHGIFHQVIGIDEAQALRCR